MDISIPILVVDDSPTTAKIISNLVRDVGYTNRESAANLDPTPFEYQIIEPEVESLIPGVFDPRPTVTPALLSKSV
jgi:CheY-like chemotaxis protein